MASPRFTLSFYLNDMGSFIQPGCRDMDDALWHVNRARAHDGLPPLTLAMLTKMKKAVVFDHAT